MTVTELLLSLLAVVLAAALSACLTWVIRPLLLRHVLANPNARSSHRVPTPQGGGIAVVAATLLVAGFIGVYADPINFAVAGGGFRRHAVHCAGGIDGRYQINPGTAAPVAASRRGRRHHPRGT